MEFENKIICGDWIKVLRGLPDGVFHCCVTSPPYWGQRDYGTEGQLGLEKTPEEHIDKLVEGFREVRRVLRDDGVLWLNYGDKYTAGGRQGGYSGKINSGSRDGNYRREKTDETIADGNLLMLPARVALALQADGWILRDDVIWAKAISFNDKYSGSTMPESVNGWRWERCRVKVSKRKRNEQEKQDPDNAGSSCLTRAECLAEWQDCPGCPKCEPNDGLVLRKGSWRCTKAHEHLFQFVKTNSYFCDMEAVREETIPDPRDKLWNTAQTGKSFSSHKYDLTKGKMDHKTQKDGWVRMSNPSGRNLRNVWTINPRGYKEAHYATYPEKLIEPCIKVSTSKKGVCPKCRSQWARVVEKAFVGCNYGKRPDNPHVSGSLSRPPNDAGTTPTKTLGWRATCECGIEETVPAIVCDPFMGSGTTALVAVNLGRNYFGIEINPEYKQNHIDERVKEAETGIPTAEAKAGHRGLFE